MTETSDTRSVTKRQKTMAILAAGLVLGLGATMTLAVWNDSEWVFGGADLDGDGTIDGPGVGISTFEVQQNTSFPYDDTAWTDAELAPGGALDFTLDALSLTPGDVVYAPVSLTTTDGSVAAADISLAGAVAATLPAGAAPAVDAGGLLFAALDLRVVVATTADTDVPAVCDAALFGPTATYVVGANVGATPALNTAGNLTTGVTTLAGDGANKVDYCFEISLPAGSPDTLQGRSVAPAWQFIANSVD